MQFDNNFALLREQLVVLQPEQPPLGFKYHSQSQQITPAALDPELAKQALAYSLWGRGIQPAALPLAGSSDDPGSALTPGAEPTPGSVLATCRAHGPAGKCLGMA